MQIGSFRKVGQTYRGRIQTLMIDLPLVLVRADRGDSPRAPDWRVHIEENESGSEIGPDIGAGWTREGGLTGHFIALQFDCPALPRSLKVNMMPSNRNEGEHIVLWSPRRQRPRVERSDGPV